ALHPVPGDRHAHRSPPRRRPARGRPSPAGDVAGRGRDGRAHRGPRGPGPDTEPPAGGLPRAGLLPDDGTGASGVHRRDPRHDAAAGPRHADRERPVRIATEASTASYRCVTGERRRSRAAISGDAWTTMSRSWAVATGPIEGSVAILITRSATLPIARSPRSSWALLRRTSRWESRTMRPFVRASASSAPTVVVNA